MLSIEGFVRSLTKLLPGARDTSSFKHFNPNSRLEFLWTFKWCEINFKSMWKQVYFHCMTTQRAWIFGGPVHSGNPWKAPSFDFCILSSIPKVIASQLVLQYWQILSGKKQFWVAGFLPWVLIFSKLLAHPSSVPCKFFDAFKYIFLGLISPIID